MKYIPPIIEIFEYCVEEGYATSGVTLYKDWRLDMDGDQSTLRTNEELTEYTDEQGEFITGAWE